MSPQKPQADTLRPMSLPSLHYKPFGQNSSSIAESCLWQNKTADQQADSHTTVRAVSNRQQTSMVWMTSECNTFVCQARHLQSLTRFDRNS